MNKSIETELKLEITEQDNRRLRENENAVFSDSVYQKTVMFDNADKIMEHTDGRIRLRQQGGKVSLSYKRPLPSAGTEKKEVELETEIGNFEVATHILRMMGYSPTTSYEKNTTFFKLKDAPGVHLEIQEYPFASFLEIEGDEEEIKKAAIKLGFNVENAIKKPVDTLFTEWRVQKGLSSKSHMTFEGYDK